jgi:curved DNA-binding protein
VYNGASRLIHLNGQTIKVTIKPGVADWQILRIEGKGEDGSNGDLYLTVKTAPHAEFHRKGNDLYCDRPVDLYTAVLGGKVRIKTMKDTVDVDIPKETPNGKMLRLLGLGMPVYGTKNEFGNLYVTIVIQLPDHLSEQEADLFGKLSALRK